MAAGDTSQIQTSNPISILREHVQLVLELCHFTEDLNPLWSAKKTFAQLRLLSDPVKEKIETLNDQKEIYEEACRYFFEVLGFRCTDKEDLSFKDSLIPQILETRQGPASMVMLLFTSLLEEANIKVQIASCRKRHLLKVQINGRAHITDFDKNGELIDHEEILNLINRGFDFSSGPLQSDALVVEYLNTMKRLSKNEKRLHIQTMIHSYLMKYQPFNLKHLSERAMVAYETGDYKTAMEDIRSYFQYKQPELTNQKLKEIYKMALKQERKLKEQICNAISDTAKNL